MNAIQMTAENEFSVTARGVSYILTQNSVGGWVVSSQRLALSAARMGGSVRTFPTLQDVSRSVKAFSGIDLLVAA